MGPSVKEKVISWCDAPAKKWNNWIHALAVTLSLHLWQTHPHPFLGTSKLIHLSKLTSATFLPPPRQQLSDQCVDSCRIWAMGWLVSEQWSSGLLQPDWGAHVQSPSCHFPTPQINGTLKLINPKSLTTWQWGRTALLSISCLGLILSNFLVFLKVNAKSFKWFFSS